MHTLRRMSYVRITIISALLLWVACGAAVASAQAQSVEEKLSAITDFVPKASTPVEQLVEVARKFRIPMGIEWTNRPGPVRPAKPPRPEQRSVQQLIEAIAVASQHDVAVVDGLVRVYSPTEAVHPLNFLNVQLKSYAVKDADLFAAEDQLRWAIRFTLEPEKYRNGFNGGYGHPDNHVFQISKFTIAASNITIREALNRITLAQGNALWITTIDAGDLKGDKPRWKPDSTVVPVEAALFWPVTDRWFFVPLAEVAELAKEQVAIDVRVTGALDQRVTTVPVMLEDGLVGACCGAMGGGSTNGVSFGYSAKIENVGKDTLTFSVHLTVQRRGETDFNFEEKIQVSRDRVIELRPEPRVRIRAYFERANQPR